MLIIAAPDNFNRERQYIIDVIFKDFLGLDYRLRFIGNNLSNYIISFGRKKVIIQDHFFNKLRESEEYLSLDNIPQCIEFVHNQFAPESDIPIIYGNKELSLSRIKITCGVDIFASSFFMLTRWEEFVNKSRDKHKRFPAVSSLAYKNNFLMRPVVNEYVEMLWNMLIKLGFKEQRKKRQFTIEASHDIDNVFQYYYQSPVKLAKVAVSDLIKKKHIKRAFKQPFIYWSSKKNPELYDPYYTFDLIMGLSERNSLKSKFYFMSHNFSCRFDGDYDVLHPKVLRLMRIIDSRGHEIGLHGSYNSYNHKTLYTEEWCRLMAACVQAKIQNPIQGSRQHYLRWDVSKSSEILDGCGVTYDTSMSYADHVGFRCGTCFEHPVFSIKKRKKLKLIEKPLIIMDKSLIDPRYMNRTKSESIALGLMLKKRVKHYNGTFSVLWHNSSLVEDSTILLYKELLS